MSNIDYTKIVGAGKFRAVRVWKDHETNEWLIDAQSEDGMISTQEWSYGRLDEALTDVPLLHAALVSGISLGEVDGQWHLFVPIVGGGLEGSVWPSKVKAETFIRAWVGR